MGRSRAGETQEVEFLNMSLKVKKPFLPLFISLVIVGSCARADNEQDLGSTGEVPTCVTSTDYSWEGFDPAVFRAELTNMLPTGWAVRFSGDAKKEKLFFFIAGVSGDLEGNIQNIHDYLTSMAFVECRSPIKGTFRQIVVGDVPLLASLIYPGDANFSAIEPGDVVQVVISTPTEL
jgi:hypothetical protein